MRIRRAPPLVSDVALAIVLSIWMLVEVLVRDVVAGPKAVVAPLFLLQTIPLAWRRSAPLLVACIAMLSVVTHAVATADAPEGGPGFVAVLVILYSLGAFATTRRALVGLAVVSAAYVVHETNNPNIESEAQFWSALFAAAIAAIVFSAGVYMRRHRQVKKLERRAEALVRERADREQRAVAEERARIARELHDIVSHSVSVMVVQAEAAEEVLARAPERVGDPLRKIQSVGREALVEMRRMLGVLRDDDEAPDLDPQPGLARIDALVSRLRTAGLGVDVRVEGQSRHVPPGIDVALYRVIQEALTNVLKHANAAHADVVIRYGDESIAVEVVDDGTIRHAATAGGHGLVGMRERLSVYGGTLSAGPRAEGGFAVSAQLPLP